MSRWGPRGPELLIKLSEVTGKLETQGSLTSKPDLFYCGDDTSCILGKCYMYLKKKKKNSRPPPTCLLTGEASCFPFEIFPLFQVVGICFCQLSFRQMARRKMWKGPASFPSPGSSCFAVCLNSVGSMWSGSVEMGAGSQEQSPCLSPESLA